MEKKTGHIDWLIFLPIVSLMLFSIAFVYSASATMAEHTFGSADKLFWSHSGRIFLGLIILLVFARIDYHFWMRHSKKIMYLAVIFLIVVLFVGTSLKGASRWINLGFVSFQPSELAKFAILVHFAALLSAKQKVIKSFENGFLPFLFWTGLICLLIALQPNFSTMIVIFLIAISMMFIGNTNLLYILYTFAFGITTGLIYAVSAEYRLNRIKSFLGLGEEHVGSEVSYQLNQALIALGNGGLFGVGAGQNRQSYLFLPESYGDFIFSIIGEEYGFIGLFAILLAFAMVFWRGMLIAKKAPDNYGYFLAIGILVTFAIYVFVNAGVNTGVLPTTGVPMPFISYGGTAVFFYAAEIGILLNISAQSGIYPKPPEVVINREEANSDIDPEKSAD